MPDKNKQCCCSHGRDGGCGKQDKGQCGNSGGCSGGCQDRTIYITEDEQAFLTVLSQIPFLPLARFVMRSSRSDDAISVALEPVYLSDKNDSLETVKKTGEILQSLEDKYLITLDYDLPLQNGDYTIYEDSGVYQAFCADTQTGITQDGITYDLPVLERGSMALTTLGQDALESLV
jgi:hypothetical protein